MIKEPDGKITPKKWRKELNKLNEEYPKARSTYSRSVYRLAGIEVLRHNRIAFTQMLSSHLLCRTKERLQIFKDVVGLTFPLIAVLKEF